jgi:hypothetical protein
VFGIAVLASVFAGHGGYASGQDFVDGLRPAVAVGAGGVFLAALVLLAVPRRRTPAQLTDVDVATSPQQAASVAA